MSLLDVQSDEVKRDHLGRYVLAPLPPDEGKELHWTRATTWAQGITDNFGIKRWESRLVARAIARSDGIQAALVATDADNGRAIDDLVEDALTRGGGRDRAMIGTALHKLSEKVDRGMEVEMPDRWAGDVAAYRAALDAAGITIEPQWIERIVGIREIGGTPIAGTFDRLVRTKDSEHPVVLDLKTGRDIAYGVAEYAIQLAIYANAEGLWDADAERWEPMPTVERAWGLIAHLPAGEATCTLHRLDLVAGWETARSLVPAVREWRKAKGLLVPYVGAPMDPPAPSAEDRSPGWQARAMAAAAEPRQAWIRRRINAIPMALRATVERRWPPEVPPRPPWTDDQIDAISSMLHGIEDAFPERDPALPDPHQPTPAEPTPEPADPLPPAASDDGEKATDEALADAAALLDALDDGQRSVVRMWSGDARREGRSWPNTVRGVAVGLAAVNCARHLYDPSELKAFEVVHAALFAVTDRPPCQRLGVEFAALTTGQALTLERLARDFGARDPGATKTIAEALDRLITGAA